MLENLKDESEEDAEMEDAQESEADSEDSGFGLMDKKKKVKKNLLKRQPKKAAVPPEAVPAKPATPASKEPNLQEGSVSGGSSVKGNKATSPDKLMAQAMVLKDSLQQVSPLTMWQMPQKAKDIDAKIKKALEKCDKLEELSDEAATKVKGELVELTSKLGSWVELVHQLRVAMDPKDMRSIRVKLTSIGASLTENLQSHAGECVKTVLLDIGKVLLEAWLWETYRSSPSHCKHSDFVYPFSPKLKMF